MRTSLDTQRIRVKTSFKITNADFIKANTAKGRTKGELEPQTDYEQLEKPSETKKMAMT